MTDRDTQGSVEYPKAWPIVAYTVAFGIFGAFPTTRRARWARVIGESTWQYWVAFGVTLAAHTLVSLTAIWLVAVPAIPSKTKPAHLSTQAAQVSAETKRIESELAMDDRVAEKSGIDDVNCTRTGPDGQGGSSYTCVVRYGDGQTRDYDVKGGETNVVSWLDVIPKVR
jgi:hypothetical protein